VEKSLTSQRAREAARKAADLVKRQNALEGLGSLPGKLADCSERDASKCELFLVEGDSAAARPSRAAIAARRPSPAARQDH